MNSATRYMGPVCNQHEALGGERLRSNGCCIGCHRDRNRTRRATAAHKALTRQRQTTVEYRAQRRDRNAQPETHEALLARKRSEPSKSRRRLRAKRRRATDITFKLMKTLRTKVHNALAGRSKSARTLALIGCTVEEVRAHLERQFLPGMTWANHGEWHIDHKRPCASFDLTDPAQQRACFNWFNLQPLWARDNQSKGARCGTTVGPLASG